MCAASSTTLPVLPKVLMYSTGKLSLICCSILDLPGCISTRAWCGSRFANEEYWQGNTKVFVSVSCITEACTLPPTHEHHSNKRHRSQSSGCLGLGTCLAHAHVQNSFCNSAHSCPESSNAVFREGSRILGDGGGGVFFEYFFVCN